MKPQLSDSCKNESNSVPCRPIRGGILRPSKGVLVKKLLTAFAFGAMVAGAAVFVTSPAFAQTGTGTGSSGATPSDQGTTPAKKHHHKSHHHKKSDTGTSSSSSGSSGTTGGTTGTAPSK